MSSEEEDYISLGDFPEPGPERGPEPESDTSSDSDATDDSDSTTPESDGFNPGKISRETFLRLRDCYPATVEKMHRQKVMLKLKVKNAKHAKRARRALAGGSLSGNAKDAGNGDVEVSVGSAGAGNSTATDAKPGAGQGLLFSKSEQDALVKEVESFLKLDRWRYETLPALVKESRGKGNKGKKQQEDEDDDEDDAPSKPKAPITKEDLSRLMEWKL